MALRLQPTKSGPELHLELSKALPQEFWSGPASLMSRKCLSFVSGEKRCSIRLEQEAHLEIIRDPERQNY